MAGFDAYQSYSESNNTDTSGLHSGDMQATSNFHSGVYRIEGGELTHTPYTNSTQLETSKGSIEATAVKPSGFGSADMSDPNTLITLNGVQASIAQFEALGMLERNPQGDLKEAAVKPMVKPEPTVQENPDEKVEPFHEEIEQEMQHFIKAMHPVAFTDALDQAVSAIVKGDGAVNIETLANHSQQDVDKTHDQMQKYLIANQVRAASIMSSEGIPESEHSAALAWAKQENPLGLHKAVEQLLKGRNGNGIRKLAEAYQRDKWLGSFR